MTGFDLSLTATGYDPTDCYWQASDGRIFSSSKGALVSASDLGLANYKASGGWVRPWPQDGAGVQTTVALQEVLDAAGVSIYADLATYANRKQWALATGGFTVTIGGKSLTFSTDGTSQALITGKMARLGQPNPPTTIKWQFPDGFTSISPADFSTAAVKIADFVQATFDTLATVFTGIKSGSIKTVADVDAAAWPINSA